MDDTSEKTADRNTADAGADTNADEATGIPDEELKKKLTPEQYHITREKGTERAFTGKYWNHKESGTYRCAVCGNPLFNSKTKYESGSGWPSFYAPVDEENVEAHADDSMGMHRVEVVCSRCQSHLGHIFEDGPEPTGQRFCVNSASLDFEPEAPSGDYPE